MKFNGAKVKLSRKLGIALTAKAAKYMEKRPYGPGVHAAGGRQRRLSDYGAQLLEKQKLRYQYNVHERQMHGPNHQSKYAGAILNLDERA